eukprot:Nk52_evm23s212 gene=Nk52_evmTU23s212
MSQRVAFLSCDFQNGILGFLPNQEAKEGLISRQVAALSAARAVGSDHVSVIHINVRFRPGYPEINPSNQAFQPIKKNQILQDGTPSADFHPDCAPASDAEVVCIKRRFGAFSTTELRTVLDSQGIKRIYLSGISTSGVILSTVRAAADMDYEIVVVEDLCADGDEEVHNVLMKKIFPRQARVISSKEFTEEINALKEQK